MIEIKERLIVSLDLETATQAMDLVNLLGEDVLFYKVGLQMFLHYGSQFVLDLKQKNKKIFLDLKLNDIPNTVSSAIKVLSGLHVDMINLHTFIGYDGMKLAAETVMQFMPGTALIGVTVLTSLGDEELQKIGIQFSAKDEVLRLCILGKSAGIHGVVSSAEEAMIIKENCGSDFITVCPGIRRATDVKNDQARIVGPEQAIRNGADYLVIGRPIIKANSPKEEAIAILQEIEKGLNK